MTDEEHHARAMLLGMCYHDGNGNDPFYYKKGEETNLDGFLNANTLEPLIQHTDETFDFDGLNNWYNARRKIK